MVAWSLRFRRQLPWLALVVMVCVSLGLLLAPVQAQLPEEGVASLPPPALSAFVMRTQELSPYPAQVLSASQPAPDPAPRLSPLPPADQAWITPAGGIFQAASISLTVAFPPGAVDSPVLIQVMTASAPSLISALLTSFSLTATTAVSTPVTTFARPVTLTLDLNPYAAQLEQLAGNPMLAWHNSISNTWEVLPSQVSWGRFAVSVAVSHFSSFGLGVEEEISYGAQHLPTLRAISTDEWSGNSSVRYPLVLPPGPGGLGLELGLTYSSEVVNSTRQGPTERPDALDRQASVIGWGWSLDGLGSITYDLDNNKYFLVAPGHSTELVNVGNEGWQTDPQQFLRIERRPSGNAQYFDRWYVWTPDGTLYVFGGVENAGFTWNSRRIVVAPDEIYCRHTMREAYLTEVHDPQGNRIEIRYNNEQERESVPSWYCNRDVFSPYNEYVRAIRLTQIKYFPAAPADQNLETVKVDFSYTNRSDTDVTNRDQDSVQTLWTDRRLTQISMKVRSGDAVFTEARRYDLGQRYWRDQESSGEAHLLLMSVTETVSTTGSLPPWLFRYDETRPLNHTLLTQVTNGQGGSVTLEYETFGNIFIQGCGQNTRRFRVTSQEVDDGLAATPPARTTYTHVDPMAWANAGDCTNFQFGGYARVERTLTEGSTTVQRGENQYHQRMDTSLDPRKGRLFQAEVRTPAGQVLRREETAWAHAPIRGTTWVYLLNQFITQENVSHLINYAYATDHQGDTQYGNVTHRSEYLDHGPTRLRTRETWYYPQNQLNGAYIVNRPARETLTDAAGTCQGETRWWYDTNTAYNQPPTKGLVTRQQIAQERSLIPDECGADWSETNYQHDEWGNRTTVTDPRSATTSTGYDTDTTLPIQWPQLYTYPVTTTAPEVGTTFYEWDKVIGQVLAVTDTNGLPTRYRYDERGRLWQVIKPENGDSQTNPTQETTYRDYTGPTSPYRVRVSQRRGPGLLPHDVYTFYDGLGREAQTRTAIEHPNQGTRTAVSFTRYNAQDLPVEVYLPVEEGASGEYNGSGWDDTRPRTLTTYDALGRPEVVTAPDTTRTVHHYGSIIGSNGVPLLWHDVIDGNRHRRQVRTDLLGRVVQVDEISGHCSRNYWPEYACDDISLTETWDVYTSTLYVYDTADRLASVTDGFEHTTTIGYDLAGRKTSLADPDLGQWQYAYDNAGNLETQTDARGCLTTMNYDTLSRLRTKSYSGPGRCGSTPGVSYTYDDTTNSNRGKGRRTGMTDGSGETSWRYDGRGRLVQEVKTIAGRAFTTTWAYDSSDQVVALTYPDNETLTFAYHRHQRLNTLASGSVTYVAESDYDVWGRLSRRQLGTSEGLQVAPLYYDWQTGQGRLQTLRAGTTGQPTRWQNLHYAYDSVGNVITATDNLTSEVQAFRYDHLDRLVSAGTTGGPAQGAYVESYTYNEIGNLLTKDGARYSYDSDKPHAVTAVTQPSCSLEWDVVPNGVVDLADVVAMAGAWDRPAPTGFDVALEDVGRVTIRDVQEVAGQWGARCLAATYHYDENGNLTIRAANNLTTTFTYDAENRLIEVIQGVLTLATFAYDGDGQRVLTTFTTHNGPSTTTRYVGILFEQSETTTRKYYYAESHRVAMRENGQLFWLLTDHLGSTSVMLNAIGSEVVSELRYRPFGEVRYATGSAPTRRRYTGQQSDSETSLLFYGARYYDPVLARFTQPDTLVPDQLNPQALNRYAYVYNNPLRFTDPSGHDASDAVLDFLWGVAAQMGYNSGWWYPPSQPLAASPGESTTTTAGRFVGDMISIAQGAAETIVGGGVAAGSGVVCVGSVGVLCGAGAVGVAAGGTMVVHGTATAVAGVAGVVTHGSTLLAMASGEGGGPSRQEMARDRLTEGLSDAEKAEFSTLLGRWGKGSFDSVEESIVYHHREHANDITALKYLRKSINFNTKGATKHIIENGVRYERKSGEFIIYDIYGNILTYGFNQR